MNHAQSHLVALSGGKDSTAMALRLMEVEPRDYQFCITPTGRELPEMTDHWARLEQLLGRPVIKVPGPSFVETVIANKSLPSWRMRFCTRQIKIEPFQTYAIQHRPAVCYVGIRADETENREGTNWNGIDDVLQDTPLVRWGWSLSHVQDYLHHRGVKIPHRTDCDCCFFQRLGEWWRLWRDHKDRWTEIEALETWAGHTLRSPNRDSWPAALKDLRARFEAGEIPKGADRLEFDTMPTRSTMCSWCAR